MKTLKFLAQKIVIIEVMLIILFFICNLFNINIDILNSIINTCLIYLTPISIIALILYIILSILTSKIIETAIGVALGGLILYYLFNFML